MRLRNWVYNINILFIFETYQHTFDDGLWRTSLSWVKWNNSWFIIDSHVGNHPNPSILWPYILLSFAQMKVNKVYKTLQFLLKVESIKFVFKRVKMFSIFTLCGIIASNFSVFLALASPCPSISFGF